MGQGSRSEWTWSGRRVPRLVVGAVGPRGSWWGVLYVFIGRLKDGICRSSSNADRFLTDPICSSGNELGSYLRPAGRALVVWFPGHSDNRDEADRCPGRGETPPPSPATSLASSMGPTAASSNGWQLHWGGETGKVLKSRKTEPQAWHPAGSGCSVQTELESCSVCPGSPEK